MGKLGVFGWLGMIVLVAGLSLNGVRWIREEAVAGLQGKIADETARVEKEAAEKVAAITTQSAPEAEAAKAADAEREQRLEALTLKIAELERTNATCGTISRASVRALNSSR